MEHRQNIYGSAQMPQPRQMVPPPQMGAPRPRGWRERWMQRFGMSGQMPRAKELTIPNWITGKSIVFFFISMFACWGAFGFVPEVALWGVAAFSVVLFFYGGQAISKGWEHKNEKAFVRNVFIAGVIVRLLWVLYLYFVFNPNHFGNTHGEGGDVNWYLPFAKDLAQWMTGDAKQTFAQIIKDNGAAIDDTGYPIWLGLIYAIIGIENYVFVPLLIKCILGAYCAVSIYRIAKRHYGDGTARLAALFVCLNPNMIYWCGTLLKEAEMVFLVCLAVDNFDRAITSGKRFTIRALLPAFLAAIALFFFRSVLAIVIFLSFFAHIVMASNRVMSFGRKLLIGLLVGAVLAVSMGDRIRTQSEVLMEKVQSDTQEKNMEWRANRDYEKGGKQTFARYAGAAVFAPLIFTIPFPTFNVAHEGQLLQMQLSGGYYIKNILSFFVIIVMIMMLISGEWRRHVFIIAYTIGYHLVLVMSQFAQSGRFHMPVWPMILLFAAYGIQIAKTNAKIRKWFPIVLVLEVAVCLVWNWFKLKGRGMI